MSAAEDELVALVREALTRWNERSALTEEAFAEFMAPDSVLDMSTNVFNPAVYEGFEGFRRFQDQVGEAWADFRMEPDEGFARGDVVVVLVRAVGTGRGSGVEIDQPVAVVARVRDGRIVRLGVQTDREAALRLVGR